VGAVALGDHLYVCGGFDGISSLDTVEKFDPSTKTWTLVASMTKNRSAAGTVNTKYPHLHLDGMKLAF
jgi:kelch-like protein 18